MPELIACESALPARDGWYWVDLRYQRSARIVCEFREGRWVDLNGRPTGGVEFWQPNPKAGDISEWFRLLFGS